MVNVLLAACMFGYVASAAAFYYHAAKTALKVEDKTEVFPSRTVLTVVEGGAGQADVLDKAA